MYCSKCGAQIPPQAAFCASCGGPTASAGPAPGAAAAAGKYNHLPSYWQAVFQRFDKRPGQTQTHWNWPSFFFGAFWYLVKGMPAKAALYFAVSIFTYGAAWLFLAIYAGLYGAWDYYLKEVYGKQLW